MQTTILSNNEIKPGYFLLELQADSIVKNSLPGQFIMIRVREGYDPLLRRPMSICSADKNKGTLTVLYQVVGRGTQMMTERKKGEEFDIIGPYGNSFTLLPTTKTALFVAGGVGVAPFYFLAESFQQKKKPLSPSIFIGGKTEDDILLTDELTKKGASLFIATEDGSRGNPELITDTLTNYLKEKKDPAQSTLMYSCGPYGMMKRTAEIARQFNITCQVSLDTRMACGIGVCMGCVAEISAQDQNEQTTCLKCVCKEGPVFDSALVVWDKKNTP